jgi:circadian clock protein KaiB
VRAIANARAICTEHFDSGWEMEIVDLLEEPERALADAIIVTPTLLKLSPLPVQRAVGDLRDTTELVLMLGGK